MSEETQTVLMGEAVESVKIERNSRGFTFSVRAGSVERALMMYDQVRMATNMRLATETEKEG